MARVIDIDAILNQPPAQRYSGPEAIARRDEMLLDRALASPVRVIDDLRMMVPKDFKLTNKDLGT